MKKPKKIKPGRTSAVTSIWAIKKILAHDEAFQLYIEDSEIDDWHKKHHQREREILMKDLDKLIKKLTAYKNRIEQDYKQALRYMNKEPGEKQ